MSEPTKIDLADTFWRAVHSDKVIESNTHKAYLQVKRATLQKVEFIAGPTKFEFKRPDNVSTFDIRWRLRTRVNLNNNSHVEERHWVIDDGKFHIINESLELHTHNSCEDCDKKPITNTPNDNL